MPDNAPAPRLDAPRWRSLAADYADDCLSLTLEGRPLISLRRVVGERLELHPQQLCAERVQQAVWAACYWSLASDADCQRLLWVQPAQGGPDLTPALASGLLLQTDQVGRYLCERSLFWQLPQPWLGEHPDPAFAQQMQISDGKRHPRRPPKPQGEVYRRFDTRLGMWVSLRALDVEHDLERFSRWQNSARVLEFWQEGGSLEQHRQYLSKLQADPHSLSLIGCFDDQPFAYFEAYWAKEDRLAPFYAVDDYDRGMHMLVGEEAHRGPHKVASWMSALVHYLFLDDPRTQRVVAEPRADNAKMISYLHSQRFHCEKEFDFPHKRAALMVLGRERFFERCSLV